MKVKTSKVVLVSLLLTGFAFFELKSEAQSEAFEQIQQGLIAEIASQVETQAADYKEIQEGLKTKIASQVGTQVEDYKQEINSAESKNALVKTWGYLVSRVGDSLDFLKDLVKIGFDSTRILNAAIGRYRDTYLDTVNYNGLKVAVNGAPDFKGTGAAESLNNYHEHIQATVEVQTDADLWPREKDYFIPQRLKHVERNIQKLFPAETLKNSKPRIAICASGGGFRAMMATAGLYKALETELEKYNNVRLIDTVTWAAVLSGSTWVTAPRAMGKSTNSLIDGYKKYAQVSLSQDSLNDLKKINFTDKHLKVWKDNIWRKFYWDQPIDAMDAYGTLVAQMVLSPFDDSGIKDRNNPYQNLIKQNRQRILFSQALQYLEADECGNFPLPIATAVSPLYGWWNPGRQRAGKSRMQWFNFTPYALESYYFNKDQSKSGAHIPIWSVGRRFEPEYEKGTGWWAALLPSKIKSIKSKEGVSELPLGNLLATWGSAFAVAPPDVIRIFINSDLLVNPTNPFYFIMNLMTIAFAPLSSLVGSVRLVPSTIHNYTQHLDGTTHSERALTFVDAGIDFNLPVPALLATNSKGKSLRKPDIILVLDASQPVIAKKSKYKNWYSWEKDEVEEIMELIKAEEWARCQSVPFPKIKGSDAHNQVLETDEDGHAKQAITVFPSQDGSPTLIFIPLIDNTVSKKTDFNVSQCMAADCNTFNFKYSTENVDGLVGHVEQTVLQNIDVIMNEIRKVAVTA